MSDHPDAPKNGVTCAWCDSPAITWTDWGARACFHHAALDAVRQEAVRDSKIAMDKDQRR